MKLYLAGPDVFHPEARARAETMRLLCAQHGHEALIPLDGVACSAAAIYASNIAMIRSADRVIANLQAFRGVEPDSGTAFEVGFAVALGKPVIAYLECDESIRARVARLLGGSGETDQQGWLVEDFGLPLNLMLAIPSQIVIGDFEAALRQLDTAVSSSA